MVAETPKTIGEAIDNTKAQVVSAWNRVIGCLPPRWRRKVVAAIVFMAVASWVLDGVRYVTNLAGWFGSFFTRDEDRLATRGDIAKLTAAFERQAQSAEKTGGKPPVGSIERAVAAARDVLESDDPAKRKARRALQAGDLPAAETALAEAYQREAADAARLTEQAQQLKAKAAGTAREKAALAATRSVAEAITWYSKAAILDPSHFWTQVELSRLHMAAGDLPAAAGAVREASETASDERERMVSLSIQGDVSLRQGNLRAAADNFETGLAIAERLAEDDPSNAGLQRDLSVSHNKIGDVRRDQGDLTAALHSFEAGLAIRERLAEDDPSNARLQRDLSVSHNKIGDVRRDQRDLAAALHSFQAGLAIRERLAEDDTSNAGLQRDLSVSHDRIGDVRRDQGNLAAALHSFEAGLDIAERLAKDDLSNAGLQRDLSVSHRKIGDVLEAMGDIAGAVAAYERSLPIAEALAERWPEHPRFRADLEITRKRLARLRERLG